MSDLHPRRRRSPLARSRRLTSRGSSTLPFEILHKIASPFRVPDLWAASLVCRSWRDALRPLREAATLVYWGKRFKHGSGGIRPNRDKALESFLKGAARGWTAAMVDAGLMYWEMGKKEEAVELYGTAAELGDRSGWCNLGIFYLKGDHPNLEEAAKLFHLAACAGHVRAQYNLALCLQHGRGVERNMTQAAKWYLKAAQSGNERAMYNTSLCYSLGEGFVKDDQLAKIWLRRAADHGHHKAEYEHGLRLLSAGEVKVALVYLELATRVGVTAAVNARDEASQRISSTSRAWAISAADKRQRFRKG